MKFQTIWALAAVLTLAILSGQTRASDIDLENQAVINGFVVEAGKKLAKECFLKTKDSLYEGAKKTLTNMITAIKEKKVLISKDKKFSFKNWFKNTPFFKWGKSSVKDCVKKSEEVMNATIENAIEKAASKFEDFILKGFSKVKVGLKHFFG